jgi:hypothetical protein
MTAEESTIISEGRARHKAVRRGRWTDRTRARAVGCVDQGLKFAKALLVDRADVLDPLKALAQYFEGSP